MGLDEQRATSLVSDVSVMFDTVFGGLKIPKHARAWLQDKIAGPAFREIEELVSESRPPRIYLFGRSGHGKSSLLNALTGRTVAAVGDIVPTTVGAETMTIAFPTGSQWEIIDSRGIFETTRPDGAVDQDPLAQAKSEMREYRPDVVLHVVAAPEARSMKNDFIAYREVCAEMGREFAVPTIIVLNKADTLGGGREWPPAPGGRKTRLLVELLDYVATVIDSRNEPIVSTDRSRGSITHSNAYLAILPVCSYSDTEQDDRWNIETLASFIGKTLPRSAQLAYYQGQGRKMLLRELSTSLIGRFSAIAGTIGATPTPFVDNIVIAPLQMLMVAGIGGLSGRSFTIGTAKEYAAASGVAIGGAQAIGILRGVVELTVPIVGHVISGGMAAANTYALGKAAEAYFFAGEKRKPSDFAGEARARTRKIRETV